MTTNASSKLDFVLRLIDQVTAPARHVRQELMQVADVGKNGFKQLGAGVVAVTGSIMALRGALAPALEQGDALGELAALGVASDALDELNQKSMEFAANYGEHATAFVRSAYAVEGAIKGLAGSELATFTHASNLLAKATRADADTMSTYIGTMYGLFQDQADTMGRAQWVEQLTGQTALAVKLFRASGAQINDAFKTVGVSGSAAGVALHEQMAIFGALSNTMDGGAAGGMYKSFLENVGAAQAKLGMTFTDSEGRLLPILQILGKLEAKFGNLSKQADLDALQGAFGGEASKMLVTLLKDTSGLVDGLDQLGKVKGMEQAERMARSMIAPWSRLDSVIENVRITFGQILLPVLNPLIERLILAGNTFQRWAQMFPNIARWLGYITLGVLVLVAAAGALTILGGLASLLSLLMSPIALVVLGIGLLVVAIGAAVIWWDELQAAFGQTAWFQALVAVLTPAVLLFRILWAVLQFVGRGLSQLWEMATEVAGSLGLMSEGAGLASSAWDAFLYLLTNVSPFALIGKALKGLIELLNKIPGVSIDTSFAELPQVPQASAATNSAEHALAAQKFQQTINAAIPSLSPTRPAAIPPGGLLTRIQNTTSSQSKGNHIEKVEIHTGQPMTPLQLEKMLEMAAG